MVSRMSFIECSTGVACEGEKMNRADYEADICGRLDQAERVPFKPVFIGDWRPQVAQCHENVDAWVKGNLGAVAVRGWVTYASFGELGIGLTAHSVVQDSDGRLFDITPLARSNETPS